MEIKNTVEFIIGVCVCGLALLYGLIRILAIPLGFNFSSKAIVRYIIFTLIAVSGEHL